jgi:diadenylate cyclase
MIYSILYFLRGTRAAPVLSGITIIVFLLSLVSNWLELLVIEWLLMKLWAVMSFAVLVIFQPEIRRALAETGSQLSLQRADEKGVRETIEILLDSVFYLAERRLGALIVLQQKIGMRALAETGTLINAPLSRELLSTFFFPNTPLHDGGVVIRDKAIVAAGCILPLTQDTHMAKSLGTRHRAGVGVTEETDALAIIVSEETGAVSLAYKGRLLRGLSRQRLERHLVNHLWRSRERTAASRLAEWMGRLRLDTNSSGHPEEDSGAA